MSLLTDMLQFLSEVCHIPDTDLIPGLFYDAFLSRLAAWDATRAPFETRAFDVAPRGAMRAATVAEANPDAVRLWAIPRLSDKRYSTVREWESIRTEEFNAPDLDEIIRLIQAPEGEE